MINSYNMTFQVENEQLTFAYYEGPKEEVRLYYKDGKLFRWIQTDQGKEAVIHDNEFDNEIFIYWEQQGIDDFQYAMNK